MPNKKIKGVNGQKSPAYKNATMDGMYIYTSSYFPFIDELCKLTEELCWFSSFGTLIEHDAHFTICIIHFLVFF